jgi:hypothetical protein
MVMADEALRALEREARARPDDRAATLAYVRALERTRDRPGLRLSLCTLARAGDALADDALARWAATGSPEPAATSVDLTRARATVVKTKRRAPATPVAVTQEIALCVAGRELVAFDLTWRREAWAHPATECLIAAWGDDVVHLDDRGQVVVRDASSGIERGRFAVPFAASIIRVSRGRILVIDARLPRSLAAPMPLGGHGPERMACFDLIERPARPLWTTDALEHDTVSVVETAHGLVRLRGLVRDTVARGWGFEVVDLGTGTITRERTRPEHPVVHAQDVITPDRRALLLRTSHGPPGRQPRERGRPGVAGRALASRPTLGEP